MQHIHTLLCNSSKLPAWCKVTAALTFLKQLLEHRGLLGFRHCSILIIIVCSNVLVAVLGMMPCE